MVKVGDCLCYKKIWVWIIPSLISFLGVASIIVGVVFFCLSDSRQKKIDIFNNHAHDWDTNYINDMYRLYDKKNRSLVSVNFGVLSTDNSKDITLESLRNSHDDPEVRNWKEEYFSLVYNYGYVPYDPNPVKDYVTFRTPKYSKQIEFVKFHETYTTVGDDDDSYHDEVRQCEAIGGYYSYSRRRKADCFFHYRTRRVCVLVNPLTFEFEKLDSSATSHGCYQKQVFKHGTNWKYPVSYMDIKKDYSKDFLLKFEVRYSYDPEVKLSVVTDGYYDFGMSMYAKRVVAIVCVCVGAFIILMMLLLYFLHPFVFSFAILCLNIMYGAIPMILCCDWSNRSDYSMIE